MIQIKKTLLTLVALLAVTAGAWADDTPLVTINASENSTFLSGSKTFDDKVTVEITGGTLSYYNGWEPPYAEVTITITAANNDYDITSVKFYGENDGFASDDTAPFSITLDGVGHESKINGNWTTIGEKITKIEVYGAAASSGTPVTLTRGTGDAFNTWTLAKMPAGNVVATASYYDVAEFATNGEPKAEEGVLANTDAPLVSAGVVKNIGNSTTPMGTVMYCVVQPTGNDAPEAPEYDDEGWTDEVPTADGLEEGTYYVWYYIKGAEPANINDRSDENTCSDSPITALGTTGFVEVGPEPSYKVELAENTDDAAKWKIAKGDATPDDDDNFPLTGVKKGDKVTVKYNGERKVIGVKAEKKAPVVDLSKLTEGYEAQNGDVLIGTLNGAQKITIADGATVTLAGVTINGVHSDWYLYAGITCLGDATIILKDGTTNTVEGFDSAFPGIKGAAGKTLTITGTGSLYASCDVNGSGAGIGSASYSTNNPERACGNIVIEGGTITAVGGYWGAGIGSGGNASCGNITIKSTVTHVTATKGGGAPDSIGAGESGSCGTKDIEDASKVTEN